VDGAVARDLATVNQCLFNNAYFRSIDALLLTSFRFATLIKWLSWLLTIAIAVLVDGCRRASSAHLERKRSHLARASVFCGM